MFVCQCDPAAPLDWLYCCSFRKTWTNRKISLAAMTVWLRTQRSGFCGEHVSWCWLFFCLSQWLQRHLTIVKFKKRCKIENLTEETLFQEKGGALTGIFKKSLKRSESPPSEEVSCALLVFISWYPLSRENEPCCVKLLKKPLQSCHWSSLLLQPLLRRRPTLSAQIVKLWRARRWHFLSHHFRARMRSSSSLKEITLCLIWLFVSGKRGDI